MSQMRISFALGWSLWFVLLVCAASLGAMAYFYWRSARRLRLRAFTFLLGLRLLALLTMLLVLFRPVISFERTFGERPHLLFLFDTSRSMSISDFPNLPSRLARVRNAFLGPGGVLSKGERDFQPHLFSFASGASPIKKKEDLAQLGPEGQATNIARALKQALAETNAPNLAGIILFSDGIDNSGVDVPGALETLSVPIFPVGVGTKLRETENYKDIILADVDCPPFATVDNITEIGVLVEAAGFADQVVAVTLRNEAGAEVAQDNLVLDNAKGHQRVGLKFTPHQTGRFKYDVSIPVDPLEKIAENNSRILSITVTDPKIKVLYIEGALRWEYKYLKRALEMDPNVELLALVRTAPNVFYQQGNVRNVKLSGPPQDEEGMKAFDVIILGDVDSSLFTKTQMEAIREMVKAGGGLLMLAGENSFGRGGYGVTAVEEALPVICGERGVGEEREAFSLKITPAGLGHTIFSGIEDFFTDGGLPKLAGLNRVKRSKPGAEVLAVHPQRKDEAGFLIVLAVEEFGSGRSMAFTASGSWRWFLPLKGMGRNSPYVKFWGQAVRWLAGKEIKEKAFEPGIIAYTDKGFYMPGEKVHIFAQVRGEEGQLTSDAYVEAAVTLPDGRRSKLDLPLVVGTLGDYEAYYDPSQSGEYTVEVAASCEGKSLGEESFSLDVGRASLEFEELDINDELLKRIAEVTGGKYYSLIGVDRLFESLEKKEEARKVYEEKRLWNSPLFFGLFVALLTTEWALRKRWQLL